MSWITYAIVIGVAFIGFLVAYKLLINRQEKKDEEALEHPHEE